MLNHQVAVNDLTAVGILKAARKLGIDVPKDLKIVGFENSKSGSICDPELTTVDQFGYKLGKKAMTILLDRIKNDSSDYKPVQHVIKTKLIVRGSS
jgi:LacI family transcriptional regulator